MSEKDIDRFDRQMRAILEDASEEVPESVWEGVSARMNRRLIWRRVAAISSVAALLVAGVFFAGKENSNNHNISDTLVETELQHYESTSKEEDSATDVAASESSLLAEATASLDMDGLAAETIPSEANIARNAVAGDAISTAEIVEEVEEDQQDPNEAEETAVEHNDKGRAVDNHTEAGEKASEEKTWEEIEKEERQADPKSSSRIALTASSNVMSNGDAEATSGFHIMKANGSGSGTYIRQTNPDSDTYSIPLTFGIGFRYTFAPKWSVGTGISYSIMERTFAGQYSETKNGSEIRSYNGDIRNTLHYIGIPLDVYYDFIGNRRLRVYGFVGGSIEKAVGNSYRMLDTDPFTYHKGVDGVQFSVGAGFGVEYLFSDHLGIYIDPNLRYYFDCDQPVSIRTQQSLMMGFEVGLRFDL